MTTGTILIIGAGGQIGTELLPVLRARYGNDQVIASDIRVPEQPSLPFIQLDVLDRNRLAAVLDEYDVRQIYHLAAILSAKGEAQPLRAWDINMGGLFNVLELSRLRELRIFFPSSIAVFGRGVAQDYTPQQSPLHPTTVYGISKAAGENWGQYYFEKYGLDIRSLRYPGIIGPGFPGGGTTDYAVDIFHAAISKGHYSCFLKSDARLPMMYMPDAIRATVELMEAPAEQIRLRTSYNLSGMSFHPEALAEAIRVHLPDFSIQYAPDHRQAIAESWPYSIDDSAARNDWGWQPEFDLARMTADMLKRVRAFYPGITA